ncbi:Uncharacterised protein [Vibrio cholerae]|nr:Uncharacterised protein [Vibrio cholerae]
MIKVIFKFLARLLFTLDHARHNFRVAIEVLTDFFQ